MYLGQHFPISDYYKDHIVDAETISNTGQWWMAVLVIKDPNTQKPFTALYRWRKREGVWKNHVKKSPRLSETGREYGGVITLK